MKNCTEFIQTPPQTQPSPLPFGTLISTPTSGLYDDYDFN